MKTVTVPFDLEMARKIQNGEVEVPTMDDRQEIDLKSSVPVKRQYVQV